MNIWEIFSNRELALFIWGIIFLVLILFFSDIRISIIEVVKALSKKQIIISILMAAIYSIIIIYILSIVNFWNISFLKGSIFWFLGAAFVMMMQNNDARTDKTFFRKILKDNLKLILLLEFILNFYFFSLAVELILLPILVFITALAAVAQTKEEYKPVHKLLENALSLIGTIFIIIAIYKVINEFNNFASVDSLKSFLLPIILTVLFLPYLYLLALYSSYELLYVRIDLRKHEEKDLYSYAKRKIFLNCKFNLSKIRKISNNINVIAAKTKDELNSALIKSKI